MRKIMNCSASAALFALLMTFASIVHAGEKSDEKAMAIAMVKKAISYYKVNTLKKTLEEFNNPNGKFVDRSKAMHVFAYDLKGTSLANLSFPALVGTNVMNVPDEDGKLFRKEIITVAKKKGSCWIDYRLRKPKSNEIENRTAYFERIDDLVIGCAMPR